MIYYEKYNTGLALLQILNENKRNFIHRLNLCRKVFRQFKNGRTLCIAKKTLRKCCWKTVL